MGESRYGFAVEFVERSMQDVQFAFRSLLKSPGLTIVTVLTLGFGIGTATAIFTQVDSVILETLPVRYPAELRFVEWTSPDREFPGRRLWDRQTDAAGNRIFSGFPYPTYLYIEEQSTAFANLSCFSASQFNLGSGQGAERVEAELVSGDYFQTLAVDPVLGRLIDGEDADAAAPVVVIGYGLWQRRFGGSLDVIGEAVRIDGNPFEIIGVTPTRFSGLDPSTNAAITVPMGAVQSGRVADANDWSACRVVGRLGLGQSVERARSEAETLVAQSILEDPPGGDYQTPRIVLSDGSRGLDALRRATSVTLAILMSAVAMVLIIACANVAGLLLSKAASRAGEVRMRAALGATRGRLIRQFFTESLVLSACGGVLGIGLTYLLIGVLPSAVDGYEAAAVEIAPDGSVLFFAVGLSVVVGLLFGTAPALHAARLGRTDLRDSAGRLHGQGETLRMRKVFLTMQVALSLMLLVGAGLCVVSLVNLRSIPLSFRDANILVFRIDPTANGYSDDRRMDFYLEATRRIEAIPTVTAVSLSFGGRLRGAMIGTFCTSEMADIAVDTRIVSPEYFATWGIPILRGRDFRWDDSNRGDGAAIVSEAFAEDYLRGDPVGQVFGDCPDADGYTVVGVVADSRSRNLHTPPQATMHLLANERSFPQGSFAVRSSGSSASIVAPVQRVISELDPNLPIYEVATQADMIDGNMNRELLLGRILTLFASAALFLACMGLYGTLRHLVDRRRREIGIRMALGAQKGQVVRSIVSEALIPVGIGLSSGTVGVLILSRWIESMLFGVSRNDPAIIGAAAIALVLTAAVAAFLPARRAATVDPITALRHD